jgi:hypothetical protein
MMSSGALLALHDERIKERLEGVANPAGVLMNLFAHAAIAQASVE